MPQQELLKKVIKALEDAKLEYRELNVELLWRRLLAEAEIK